jgi:hypothetical protein
MHRAPLIDFDPSHNPKSVDEDGRLVIETMTVDKDGRIRS